MKRKNFTVLMVAIAVSLSFGANAGSGQSTRSNQLSLLPPDDGGGGTGGGGTGGGGSNPPDSGYRGGSNYAWYYVSPTCVREPYGVLPNFHLKRTTIETQLIQMFDEGQRRLRVPIYFHRGSQTGTVFNSTGGTLGTQALTNIRDLILTARAVGFLEFQVGFFPIGDNDAKNWTGGLTETRNSYINENWGVIQEVMGVLRSTGVFFRVDLGNETFHVNSGTYPIYDAWTLYQQEIWKRFRTNFSVAETIGFSIRQSEIGNLDKARVVYGDFPPYVMDVHLYSNYSNDLARVHSELNSANYKYTHLVVGEAPYNDATAAADIANGKTRIGGRTLFYVTQWPLETASQCGSGECGPAIKVR